MVQSEAGPSITQGRELGVMVILGCILALGTLQVEVDEGVHMLWNTVIQVKDTGTFGRMKGKRGS